MGKCLRNNIVLLCLFVIICVIVSVYIIQNTFNVPEYMEGFEKLVQMSHKEYMECRTKAEAEEVILYITSVYPEADPKYIKDKKLQNFYNMCLQYDDY